MSQGHAFGLFRSIEDTSLPSAPETTANAKSNKLISNKTILIAINTNTDNNLNTLVLHLSIVQSLAKFY